MARIVCSVVKRPGVRVRAVKVRAEVCAYDRLRLVLGRFDSVYSLFDKLGDFVFGEGGVEQHVGHKLQALADVFLYELRETARVVISGACAEQAADEI